MIAGAVLYSQTDERIVTLTAKATVIAADGTGDLFECSLTSADVLSSSQAITPTDEMRVVMYSHAANGGIKINKTAFTGVEGLYGCGEATGGMHDADRIEDLSSAHHSSSQQNTLPRLPGEGYP